MKSDEAWRLAYQLLAAQLAATSEHGEVADAALDYKEAVARVTGAPEVAAEMLDCLGDLAICLMRARASAEDRRPEGILYELIEGRRVF